MAFAEGPAATNQTTFHKAPLQCFQTVSSASFNMKQLSFQRNTAKTPSLSEAAQRLSAAQVSIEHQNPQQPAGKFGYF